MNIMKYTDVIETRDFVVGEQGACQTVQDWCEAIDCVIADNKYNREQVMEYNSMISWLCTVFEMERGDAASLAYIYQVDWPNRREVLVHIHYSDGTYYMTPEHGTQTKVSQATKKRWDLILALYGEVQKEMEDLYETYWENK